MPEHFKVVFDLVAGREVDNPIDGMRRILQYWLFYRKIARINQ
jgi:hypothetical protein